MIVIVGSGPSAISAASALLKRKHSVTILDVGFELENHRRDALKRISAQKPDQWEQADLEKLRGESLVTREKIPRRKAYGSEFPFSQTDSILESTEGKAVLYPSFAKGGLSNVWGGAALPYRSDDLKDWPIDIADLAPHYEAVLSESSFSAVDDSLKDFYPLYNSSPQQLRPSKQASSFLSDLERSTDFLRNRGIVFGRSRLMLQAEPKDHHPGCVHCGLCLYGCPYQLIYSSVELLEKFLREDKLRYVPGVQVERLKEESGNVRIFGKQIDSGDPVDFEADRVILACGSASSTLILLRSLGIFGTEVPLLTNQAFLLPILRLPNIRDVINEKDHTLAQAFIEFLDLGDSKKSVHLQLSTFSDAFLQPIADLLGKFEKTLRPLVERFLLGRLMVLQGYLHSAHSPVLMAQTPGEENRLLIRPQNQNAGHPLVRHTYRRLFRLSTQFKAIPLVPQLRILPPGEGSHIGGSFPMKESPKEFESDILGRPCGLERVHVVDSTVFSSIPPNTITLSVMANAHRIASNLP